MEQYDTHMKEILPDPKLLPIKIKVMIQRMRNGQLNTVDIATLFQVKPYETVNNLLSQIKAHYEEGK